MEKTRNKGSASAETAIETLLTKNTVRATSENVFKSVLKMLRTSYKEVINGKNVTVNFGELAITLN